jgi:hypothetical protein
MLQRLLSRRRALAVPSHACNFDSLTSWRDSTDLTATGEASSRAWPRTVAERGPLNEATQVRALGTLDSIAKKERKGEDLAADACAA